jgi:hypothetical protein
VTGFRVSHFSTGEHHLFKHVRELQKLAKKDQIAISQEVEESCIRIKEGRPKSIK